jgi:8-oxo-dGTP pyrophosphatase MutT (NUDIX family)
MKHSVSLLIQESSGAFLVIQRGGAPRRFENLWEFPGGKVDPGETPHQALLREVREETGLNASVPESEPAFRIAAPGGGGVEYAFFAWQCPPPRPEIRLSDEHQAFQWLSFAEARRLKLMEPHRKFLERYWHQQQIAAYQAEWPHYQTYAAALERVLKKACALSVPESVVQARPKSIASFAEKCVRKQDRYPDAVNQMTDLCGGRVILPTLEQVRAFQQFVEHNFEVLERDDKTTLLGEDKFGYRDMHYLVRLKPERAEAVGFAAEECQAIGSRIAELQVRSFVQHVWADILHDRIYKAPLKLSGEARRTGALLAAVMEDCDRSFNALAGQLDGMAANYSAYVSPDNLDHEIKTQNLLLASASGDERPGVALRVARLIAARGEWEEIVTLLRPHQNETGPLEEALLLELGGALCHAHRASPKSAAYREGQEFLQRAIQGCEHPDFSAVPNLRRICGLHSRALARLGWSWEPLDAEAYRARDCYRRAVELEPANPYYLADMLGFELKFAAGFDIVAGFRAAINSALATCRQHAIAGTELPAAFFTSARLNLLLGEYYSALNDYACGIRHWLSREGSLTRDFVEDEIAWLHRVQAGKPLPEEYRWAGELLLLVQTLRDPAGKAPAASNRISAPVLMVAGGAAGLAPEKAALVESLLREALPTLAGTVVSGGSTSGVSGLVGKVAGDLARAGRKNFKLLGYIPQSLPHDAGKDERYDEVRVCGSNQFTPAQVLCSWNDLLNAGIKPSDVWVLGFGGGKISAFEYRLALALGATVGVVHWPGDAAEELLSDPLWPAPNLFPLPRDAKTIRAFVVRDGCPFGETELVEMAREFHNRYRADNPGKIKPDNLKPWEQLPDTYRTANLEQAAYVIRILEAAGFGVRKTAGKPVIFGGFTAADIELMAELEHGRWNIERLRDHWRYGPVKDEDRRLHPCLVAWTELPDGEAGVKKYDRDAVRAFPEILARAGLEVFRK